MKLDGVPGVTKANKKRGGGTLNKREGEPKIQHVSLPLIQRLQPGG